jgi:hypothetical protein
MVEPNHEMIYESLLWAEKLLLTPVHIVAPHFKK